MLDAVRGGLKSFFGGEPGDNDGGLMGKEAIAAAVAAAVAAEKRRARNEGQHHQARQGLAAQIRQGHGRRQAQISHATVRGTRQDAQRELTRLLGGGR